MAFDLGKSGFGEKISKLEKLQMIPLDDIQENSQNFYSMDGIAELAASIEMVGLLHPISVVSDGGNYRLVSGHRRLAAYQMLYMNAERGTEKFHEYSRIPAIVLRDMDDLKETMAIITANSTARELTYDEKLKQEKILRETLQAMKDAGMDVPKSLGKYIADQMGVSQNEVSRMNSINKNLIPEAREKVASGEMNANQAYELSRKPKEEQESSFVSDLAQKYAEESMNRKRNLNEYIRVFANRLARHATWHGCSERYESISSLKEQESNRGGNTLTFVYSSSGRGLSISRDNYTNDRLYTWTEVWDALALYAIEQLAKSKIKAADDKNSELLWQTGAPKESGEYVAVFNTPGMKIKRLCYFDRTTKDWTFSKGGTIIKAACIMWFPLPKIPEVL